MCIYEAYEVSVCVRACVCIYEDNGALTCFHSASVVFVLC